MGQTLDREEFVIGRLPDAKFREFWPDLERELDRVPHIWEPHFTKEYLRTCIEHQGLQVFVATLKGAVKSYFFAHFIDGPRGQGLRFVLALGNSLDEALPQLEAYFERVANEMNCDYVEVCGREGWLRKLKGFKRDYTVISKQLRKFKVQ